MPPGQDDDATSILRSLKMRSCISSKPIVSTSHFIRARSLLSRFEKLEKTRKLDASVPMRSSRAGNSSRAIAGWGLAPSHPATHTGQPGATVQPGRGGTAARRESDVEGRRVVG